MTKRRNAELGLGAPPRGLVAQLDNARVLGFGNLTGLITTFRREWTLAERAKVDALVKWMLEHTTLHELSIHSEIRGPITRYVWGQASSLEVAASLAPSGYFCHATAASIHGLLTYNPETIYINREQTAKPVPDGPLSQDAIDRAFAKRQRTTQDIYSWGSDRAAILCGKYSGRLGVQTQSLPDSSSTFDVTEIERTLVDLTVRPDYAGGPGQVLEAFKKSQGRVSVVRLLEILTGLGYRYPYHQAIGFYMQRAGYEEEQLARVKALGTNLAFYVGYGINERDFDASWRVHLPKHL